MPECVLHSARISQRILTILTELISDRYESSELSLMNRHQLISSKAMLISLCFHREKRWLKYGLYDCKMFTGYD
jgi:hypothetical protein